MEDLKSEISWGATYETENGTSCGDLCRVEFLAHLFGFDGVRRIYQLVQDGVIDAVTIIEDGRKVRRYDLFPSIQKYISYLSNKAYGKAGKSEREMQLREQKLEADIALKESQGELHRLRTEIASGKYVSIEEVELDYSRFFVVFKRFAMSLPTRVTGMLGGTVDPLTARKIEKDLQGEVTSLLASFVVAGITKDLLRKVKRKNEIFSS